MFKLHQWPYPARRASALGLAIALLTTAPLLQARAGNMKPGGYLTKAETGEGFHFEHRDWEIACDNTRTCRAAGYHPQNDELKVSVLLSRTAGPGTKVLGELKIGQYGDDSIVDNLPPDFDLTLKINGLDIAAIPVNALHADLSGEVITALIKALMISSRIEFVHGDNRWQLSDLGAAAALLKMDEFQGRIGTPGALARPGKLGESLVRLAVAPPKVEATPLPPAQSDDETFSVRHEFALLAALRKSSGCQTLSNTRSNPPKLEATRLSDTQMLVSALCWQGPYNTSTAIWIVQASPPFSPKLANDRATDRTGGELIARHKGRGPGDCWSFDHWSWNGKAFAQTHSSTTGMCRLMEPGGAWNLPVWVTNVQP